MFSAITLRGNGRSKPALPSIICIVRSSPLFSIPAAAAVEVLLFWSPGCPHCTRALAILEHVAAADPEVRLETLDVSASRDNAIGMLATAERLGVEAGSLPLTVVGGRAWVGYADDATTGREILAQIITCLEHGCPAPSTTAAAPGSADLPSAVAVIRLKPRI
jgi:hypothetical protein